MPNLTLPCRRRKMRSKFLRRMGLDMKPDTERVSLTEFRRGGTELLDKLRKSGRAVVLTLRGQDALVLQSPEQYAKQFEELERIQTIEGIRCGLESMEAGKSVPAGEVFAALEEKHPYLRRS